MTPPEQRTSEIVADGDTDVNPNDIFAVLANSRRRFVIAYLQARTNSMAVADVATELTKWEWDEEEAHIPKDEILSRYVSLHHLHIPKMAEAGIIEWNHDRNTVALSEASDEMLDDRSLPPVEKTR